MLDHPTYTPIDLNLIYIRGDITLDPGQIEFGAVRPAGKLPSTFTDLFRPETNWAIAEMKTQEHLRSRPRPRSSIGPQDRFGQITAICSRA